MSKKCCCCAERAPADDSLRWLLHQARGGHRAEAEVGILERYLLADDNKRSEIFIRVLGEMLSQAPEDRVPGPVSDLRPPKIGNGRDLAEDQQIAGDVLRRVEKEA